MTNQLMNPIRLIFCGVDIYMLYTFFASMFKVKAGLWKIAAYGIAVSLAIFLVNLREDTRLNLVVAPLCCLIFIWLVFCVKLNQAVAYTIIFYAVFSGGREIVFELLFRYLSDILPFRLPLWFTSGGVPLLMVEYLIGFLFLMYVERFTKKLVVGGDREFPWILVVYPMVTAVILGCFLYMDFPSSKVIQFFVCVSSFVLYFSNAAIFIALERYRCIIDKIKHKELQEARQGMENKKFQDIRAIDKSNQEFLHNIDLYLRSIGELARKGKNEEIIKLTGSLKESVKTLVESAVYSENAILDSLFQDMRQRAKEKEIKLSVFVEPCVSLDFLAEDVIISMFGNLILNAIEAASLCRQDERRIDVKLFMGNEYLLVFSIKNSYDGSLKWAGERLLSRKEGSQSSQSHGLGIGIVEALAEKYGGTLGVYDNAEKHTFSAILSLSILTGIGKKLYNGLEKF